MKKTRKNARDGSKKLSTCKSADLWEELNYTRSYTHYPQKKSKKTQDFMETFENKRFVQKS